MIVLIFDNARLPGGKIITEPWVIRHHLTKKKDNNKKKHGEKITHNNRRKWPTGTH